jgi:hypothetical protein
MNRSHLRKRDFKEAIESLLEREAIHIETYYSAKNVPGKNYLLDENLLRDWLGNV